LKIDFLVSKQYLNVFVVELSMYEKLYREPSKNHVLTEEAMVSLIAPVVVPASCCLPYLTPCWKGR